MVGPCPGHWEGAVDDVEAWRLRRLGFQEALDPEAGVALAAVRVEDPEGRPATRRAGPVASHDHLRSLADHVATESQPRSTFELEADPGRLAHRIRDGRDEPRRLEHDEADPGSPRERRETAELVGDASGALEAGREIDDEEVHGPAREQRARDREPLLGIGRGQDHEPLRPDAARDGLDRIEGLREVQPGRDRPGSLGLRHEPQRERRPPARDLAAEREAEAPRQPARPEDRVQLGEARREDTRAIDRRLPLRARDRLPTDRGIVVRRLERHRRERPDHLADPSDLADTSDLGHPAVPETPRGGIPPLRPEGREGRRHVRGEDRHRPASIEQMFE